MLDIKFIRENADAIKAGAAKKHLAVDIDALLKVDEKRRALMQETESMRAKQNEANDKMVAANPGERSMLLPELKKLNTQHFVVLGRHGPAHIQQLRLVRDLLQKRRKVPWVQYSLWKRA